MQGVGGGDGHGAGIIPRMNEELFGRLVERASRADALRFEYKTCLGRSVNTKSVPARVVSKPYSVNNAAVCDRHSAFFCGSKSCRAALYGVCFWGLAREPASIVAT